MAHIWACPPSEGDDYIFHCHPVEQKIPKHKRLVDWYKKMLDKAIKDRVVIEYKVGCMSCTRLPHATEPSYSYCSLENLQVSCVGLRPVVVKTRLYNLNGDKDTEHTCFRRPHGPSNFNLDEMFSNARVRTCVCHWTCALPSKWVGAN